MQKSKYIFLWLSLICVVVFILQNLFSWFTGLFVLDLRALYEYQIWRFVSAIFLHSGIIHLGYNLIALMLFGFILEKKIGSRNFLIVFLFSGIIANLISASFYPSSLGASGAIYGVIGCLAILDPFLMVWAFGILVPMFLAAILWILGDLLGAFGLYIDNIGHIAHLTGIFIGILFGFLFFKYRRRKIKKEKIKISEDYAKAWEDRFLR